MMQHPWLWSWKKKKVGVQDFYRQLNKIVVPEYSTVSKDSRHHREDSVRWVFQCHWYEFGFLVHSVAPRRQRKVHHSKTKPIWLWKPITAKIRTRFWSTVSSMKRTRETPRLQKQLCHRWNRYQAVKQSAMTRKKYASKNARKNESNGIEKLCQNYRNLRGNGV